MKKENVSSNILSKLNEDELFEMANIHPEETGIKTMLYATFNGAHRSDMPHWARVKVETINCGLFPITLEPKVEPLNKNRRT